MGTTAVSTDHELPGGLSPKQQRILAYLKTNADEQTYFKSRLIADDLSLSPKEVGTNMPTVAAATTELAIDKWGYSSSTTWQVSQQD